MFIIGLALVYPTFGALLYFSPWAAGPWFALILPLSKLLQFGMPLILFFRRRQSSIEIQPADPTIKKANADQRFGMILALAFGVFSFVAISTIAPTIISYLGRLDPQILIGVQLKIANRLAALSVTGALQFAFLAVVISFLHSFLEEIYWRWFVHQRLRRYMGLNASAVVGSVAFASFHFVVLSEYFSGSHCPAWLTPLLSFCVFAAGWVWCLAFEYSKRVRYVWVSHVLADLALMWIVWILWNQNP